MIGRFAAAFQFLTVIPLFPSRRMEEAEMARSMAAFPLVGAVLGAVLAGFHLALGGRLPQTLEAVLLTAFLFAMTGGFHLDGVADTGDGLFSAKDRERALEIMRDSRIGAMGAIMLFMVLALKISALSALAPEIMVPALIAAPAAGRAGAVHLAYRMAYARPGGGLGAPYSAHLDFFTVAAAIVFGAAFSWLAGPAGFGAFVAVWLWVLLLRAGFRKKFGGITGDMLGFAEETGEVVFLVTLIVFNAK